MYYSIEKMLEKIEEPNRTACKGLLNENEVLFKTVQGSTRNHQAWKGGYWDHVQEVMNIALLFYPLLDFKRGIKFTIGEALLILFLHDLEKPWSYELGPDGESRRKWGLLTKIEQQKFRDQKLKEYGIELLPDQAIAMKYVEGELNEYTNKKRMMNELAAFCHMCDVWSARGWYNHPLEKDEPWGSRQFKR